MFQVLLLIAGIGVLVGLALSAWTRRRAASRSPLPPRRPAAPAVDEPALPYLRTPAAQMPLPSPRALERRLFAATADETADPAGADHALLAEASHALDEAGGSGGLPRRPQLLPQLMQTLNDPAADSGAIAALIARDPALSGSLLRIANSPLYRLQSLPVENIERAVTILGIDGIRQIIATALLQPMMRDTGGVLSPLPGQVWEHAQLAAAAGAEYARRQSRSDAFAGQLLGLLHGLGAMTCLQALRDAHARHPQAMPSPVAIERWLGDTADAVALRIAAEWELSDRILLALDEQAPETSPATLPGRALRYGRHAAALALLVRCEALPADEAQAQLDALDPDPKLGALVWQRLTAA